MWTAAAGAAHTEPRHVLLLYSYEREFHGHAFAGLFRSDLTRSSSEPIDFIEVALQPLPSTGAEAGEATVDDIRATFGHKRLDLVVPIGGPAASFVQNYQDQLFPTTPVLMASVDSRYIRARSLSPNETAVMVEHDPPQMVESILHLLPDTRSIVVVIGASRHEQFWLSEVKRAFRRFEGQVTFVWTDQWSFADLLERCGTLPPKTAILYTVLELDAQGVPHIEEQTLDALHAAANAPMFGFHSPQLGHGIVGGPLVSYEDVSHETTTVALRLLRGESAQLISAHLVPPARPSFDSRELRRWGIPENRLEPDSVIRFRQATLWERHSAAVVVALAAAASHVLLIVGLTVGLARRRRASQSAAAKDLACVSGAESALSRLSGRLMQAQEKERAWIAKSIHDDVCQELAALTIRLQSIGHAPESVELRTRIAELCDQFAALEREIFAISDPLYARLTMLGLEATARNFCGQRCAEHAVTLDFRSCGVPRDLSQDIAVPMFRVLQEAVDNSLTHAKARRLTVTLTQALGAIEMDIADDGIGFDPEAAVRAGAVGLIGMCERLRVVSGSCAFESSPGAGTRVHVRVPL